MTDEHAHPRYARSAMLTINLQRDILPAAPFELPYTSKLLPAVASPGRGLPGGAAPPAGTWVADRNAARLGTHVRHLPSAPGGRVDRSGPGPGRPTCVVASGLDGVAWVMADACEQPLAEHDVVW